MSQETEKPENQQDYNYRPKHIFISTIDSNLATKSRVFKYISAWQPPSKNYSCARLTCPLHAKQPRMRLPVAKFAQLKNCDFKHQKHPAEYKGKKLKPNGCVQPQRCF